MALLNHRRVIRAVIVAALLAVRPESVWAANETERPTIAQELGVKAAFLLNFAAFVDWPAHAFVSDTAPIVVGVQGVDPFGQLLDEIFEGENARGRRFEVHRIPPGGDVRGCHILFVADSERRRFARVLRETRERPILTVANAPGFTELGGIVEFTMERNRVRFRINHNAAKAAGLTISSRLLRLAGTQP
jgi:hypothetical protein